MHFHVPKPLHGWRAFVGEVGIIVVGVLIALGAEQVVETLHWREEVAAERHSLLQEASDMTTAIAAREAQQSCVDRRLSEVRTVIERHQHGLPLGLVGKIGRPTRQTATRGSWQIALAGQALAHMSHREKLAFSDAFGGFDLWDLNSHNEGEAWLRLAPLNDPDLLAESDWSGIKSGYAAAVLANDQMRALAPFMIDQGRKELPELNNYQSANNLKGFSKVTDQICKPILKV